MSKDLTPRLGLIKESDDEVIDPFAYNWPVIDTAVGARMVTGGTIPPTPETYDGLIVSESTTGKSWIARADGSGGYTRKWLHYPYQLFAQNTAVPIGSGAASVLQGGLVYQAGQSINASAADVVNGALVAPLDGIYEINLSVRWAVNANGAAYRSAAIAYNSVITVAEIIKNEANTPTSLTGNSTVSTVSQFKKLVAGTTVCPALWQNTGGVLNADYYIRMMLVTPL